MATTKTTDERIAELDKKMLQIKAQKRQLQARAKADERKKRTHRLIQIGAEVEKYCGEITDLESFSKYVSQYSAAISNTQHKE